MFRTNVDYWLDSSVFIKLLLCGFEVWEFKTESRFGLQFLFYIFYIEIRSVVSSELEEILRLFVGRGRMVFLVKEFRFFYFILLREGRSKLEESFVFFVWGMFFFISILYLLKYLDIKGYVYRCRVQGLRTSRL